MPLSEHEQRMLEQIEKALYAEDPKFAHSVRARDPRVHYRRRVILAIIGFLLGVGLLVAGVIIKYIPMGVAGFLVMLACAMWALTSWRHMTGSQETVTSRLTCAVTHAAACADSALARAPLGGWFADAPGSSRCGSLSRQQELIA